MDDSLRLEILLNLWPVAAGFIGFISVIIVLAKMHADQETMKEKIRVLFDLWNSRER
jgi:hypothetical protein